MSPSNKCSLPYPMIEMITRVRIYGGMYSTLKNRRCQDQSFAGAVLSRQSENSPRPMFFRRTISHPQFSQQEFIFYLNRFVVFLT